MLLSSFFVIFRSRNDLLRTNCTSFIENFTIRRAFKNRNTALVLLTNTKNEEKEKKEEEIVVVEKTKFEKGPLLSYNIQKHSI